MHDTPVTQVEASTKATTTTTTTENKTLFLTWLAQCNGGGFDTFSFCCWNKLCFFYFIANIFAYFVVESLQLEKKKKEEEEKINKHIERIESALRLHNTTRNTESKNLRPGTRIAKLRSIKRARENWEIANEKNLKKKKK